MKFSLFLPLALAAIFSSNSLFSQTTVLDEDFSGSIPPAGWVQNHIQTNGVGWISDGAGRAWHEDEYLAGLSSENRLESPSFSLAGMAQAYLHFGAETHYSSYLANNAAGYGDGISDMQISTDGGLTWNTVWTDTSTIDYLPYGPSVSLAPFLGQSNVQVGVYFFGTYAQEWWVDYVKVDDTPVAILDTFTHPTTQHPYFLLGETDWASALAMAESLGGSLASIGDSSENTWVRQQTGNSYDMWIGINDQASEGNFVWANGEPVVYTNWANGQGQNTPTEDFGLLDGSNGTWSDFGSSLTANALVEISEPVLAYPNLVAGQVSTFSCAGLKIGAQVVFVFSTTGAGPSNTPYGILEVDPDYISPLFFAQNGRFEFSSILPVSLAGGTLYGQTIAFNNDGTQDLSNAVAEPIQ
jgi:hypothetical protein